MSQSGVVQSDQTTGSALNNHLGHNIGVFGGIDHSGIEEICAGERISSFRNCLKRYDFVRAVDVGTNLLSSGASLFTKTTLPLHPTDGSSIMKYTSSAFAGWRGSQRVKVFPLVYFADTSGGTGTGQSVSVYLRGSVQRTLASAFSSVVQNSPGLGAKISEWTTGTWDGTMITNTQSGDVLDCEIPFYANRRFYTIGSSEEVPAMAYKTVGKNPFGSNCRLTQLNTIDRKSVV